MRNPFRTKKILWLTSEYTVIIRVSFLRKIRTTITSHPDLLGMEFDLILANEDAGYSDEQLIDLTIDKKPKITRVGENYEK